MINISCNYKDFYTGYLPRRITAIKKPLTKGLPSATAVGINRTCTVLDVPSARLL